MCHDAAFPGDLEAGLCKAVTRMPLCMAPSDGITWYADDQNPMQALQKEREESAQLKAAQATQASQ